ncbi:MAG: hypothetical protein WDN45_05490 [Caulobacteraceae bacterium]
MGRKLRYLAGAVLVAAAVGGAALAQQGFGDAKLTEANLKQVAPHTWAVMGFPNIGIVVGDKATLVVDTGLGDANGATVAAIARKLSTKGQRLILTTTHFHPRARRRPGRLSTRDPGDPAPGAAGGDGQGRGQHHGACSPEPKR